MFEKAWIRIKERIKRHKDKVEQKRQESWEKELAELDKILDDYAKEKGLSRSKRD